MKQKQEPSRKFMGGRWLFQHSHIHLHFFVIIDLFVYFLGTDWKCWRNSLENFHVTKGIRDAQKNCCYYTRCWSSSGCRRWEGAALPCDSVAKRKTRWHQWCRCVKSMLLLSYVYEFLHENTICGLKSNSAKEIILLNFSLPLWFFFKASNFWIGDTPIKVLSN